MTAGQSSGRHTWRARTAAVGAALLLAVAVLRPLTSAANGAAPLQVTAVDAVGLTVSDMDRALAFYTGVLPFVKVSDTELSGRAYELLTGVFGARSRVVRLRLGAEEIELTEFLAPKGRPMPTDIRANDRLFQHIAIVVSDITKAYGVLREHGVEHASTGPQRLPDWNVNAAGISAFYFRDPDRHFLEIISFPADKGQPRWHAASTDLFLGIDHTAIVVDDTNASLRFYRDTLGMQVAGESENYDVEQEHLNNVFGARLTDHGAPGGKGARHRAPRVPGASRRPSDADRSARERHRALADHAGDRAARPAGRGGPRPSDLAGLARRGGRDTALDSAFAREV